MLHFITGCVKSGKSSFLKNEIDRIELHNQYVDENKKISYIILKPSFDVRKEDIRPIFYNNYVATKNDNIFFTENNKKIELKNYKYIFIDEFQFYDIKKIQNMLTDLLNSNKKIFLFGLNIDYKGEPFEASSWAFANATKITQLYAVCVKCGKNANLSNLKSSLNTNTKFIVEDENNVYYPVCRQCSNY